MTNQRARRKAKQARRDAARRNKIRTEATEEVPSTKDLWDSLVSGHPLGLLGLVSTWVQEAAPAPWYSTDEQPQTMDLPRLVDNLTATPTPGGGAVLAVLAELHDDPVVRARCRGELDVRKETLTGWDLALRHVEVHTAMQIMDVFGDFEYVLVGARLGEHELTCMVRLDHHTLSEVTDVFFDEETADAVLADVKQNNDERDMSISGISLADARARIVLGLERAECLPMRRTENWPDGRPLLQWLTRQLPDGGTRYPTWPWACPDEDDLFNTFFASPEGRPFDDIDCREMLSEVSTRGNGDLLRWSPVRLDSLLNPRRPDHFEGTDLSQLELPRLLRAYVPFVHAQVGIREELTAESLSVIDRLRSRYQRAVLDARDLCDNEHDSFLDAG